MGAIEDAKVYGLTIRESATDGSDFTNPAADYRRLFLGEDGLLHLRDSAGTITDIAAGAPAESAVTFTDITTNNASTTKHGYLKKLSNVSTEYMSGTGAWSTPAGGSTPTFVGARGFNSATQNITNVTITPITFNSENYDTNTVHDTGSNTSRFTVPSGKDGYWRFSGGTAWDTNNTNSRYLWWRKNGTTEINGGMVNAIAISSGLAQTAAGVTLLLAAADYMELMVYQDSGGTRAIGGTSGDPKFESWCEAIFLGA